MKNPITDLLPNWIPIYDLKQLGVVMVIMITIIGGTGVLTVRHQGESLR